VKKCQWPLLARFINLSFSNEELAEFYLCLHAPKLDAKVASIQLVGASSLAHLTSEQIEADFVARGRLADILTNWVTFQAFLKNGETFGNRFGNEIPTEFASLSEVLKVLVASLFLGGQDSDREFFQSQEGLQGEGFYILQVQPEG